jgi:hypothetical protein
VSLRDATIGEDMLLVNYRHQPAAFPFQAAHAIYGRAFDNAGIMRTADLVACTALAPLIERVLATPCHAYLQLHFAAFGCYAARWTEPEKMRATQ